MLDQVTQGALLGEENGIPSSISYRFALPETQDVVISLDADKTVYGSNCVEVSTAASTVRECPGGGGGGADFPTHTNFYFLNDGNPRTRQFFTFHLFRPFEELVHYTLAPHLVTSTPLSLAQPTEVSADDALFQSYTFEHDSQLPFTVEAEEFNLEGDFLWVAYEPVGEIRDSGAFAREELLIAPKYLDSAGMDDDRDGLQRMALFYLGGETFRLFVRSDADYSLHSAAVETLTLEAGEILPVELSYRQPMQVVRLNSANAGEITFTIAVTEGMGVYA